MKRKASLITFLLFVSVMVNGFVAFAAAPTFEVTGDTNFKVVLRPTADMSSYEFGFSTTPVLQWNSNPVHVSNAFTLEPYLDQASGDSFAKVPDGIRIYVYWKMYTLKGVTLELSLTGPLTIQGTAATSNLDWFVYWHDASAVSEGGEAAPISLDTVMQTEQPKLNSKNGNSRVILKNFDKYLTLQNVAGSTELRIVTDKLEGKSVSGTYTGSIKLYITVKE